MSLLQPRKEGLHFILSDNDDYDFDVKVRRCKFVGFINDVINRGYLGYVFCFRLKEKEKDTFYINFYSGYVFCFRLKEKEKDTFYINFYSIIVSKIFFFLLLQLNNYNGYMCAIYNYCFL